MEMLTMHMKFPITESIMRCGERRLNGYFVRYQYISTRMMMRIGIAAMIMTTYVQK